MFTNETTNAQLDVREERVVRLAENRWLKGRGKKPLSQHYAALKT